MEANLYTSLPAGALLNKWIKSQGYWGKGQGSSIFDSHLFLDGGKASVPPEMTGALNNIYATALFRGEVMFVVEKKPPMFKLAFDLDMKADLSLSPETIVQFATEIHRVVQDFYTQTEMIVCLSEPKKTKGHWKVGAHLIWPGVTTVTPDALRCREACLADPGVQAWGGRFQNGLDAILDKCVLDKNGIRMIGSYKIVPCRCSKTPCEKCKGSKKLIEHGVYWPKYRVNAEGKVEEVPTPSSLDDMRHWVQLTSLRNCKGSLTGTRRAAISGTMSEAEEADEEGLLRKSCGRLTRAPLEPLLPHLDKFKETLPPPYWTSKWTAAFKGSMDDDPGFFVSTNARHCLNIGKCHNSNNVYFLFTKRGAFQMCFCRCQTMEGRKYGLCQDFHSQAFPIHTELKVALFGEQVLVEADRVIQPSRSQEQLVSLQLERLMAHMAGAKKPKGKNKKRS